MKACPVQLQAGLNRGLLRRYYVKKKNGLRNIKHKRSPQQITICT